MLVIIYNYTYDARTQEYQPPIFLRSRRWPLPVTFLTTTLLFLPCVLHAYLILLYSVIIIVFFENANNNAPYYAIFITQICQYTGCNRRNGPDFVRVFLILNYTEKPQNTYIQSSMVTEI